MPNNVRVALQATKMRGPGETKYALLVTCVLILALNLLSRVFRTNQARPEHVTFDTKPTEDTAGNDDKHGPARFNASLPLMFARAPHPDSSKVPSIVHFSFGMSGEPESFGLIQYLSVASALHVLKPQHAYLHCLKAPVGLYWDLVKHHVEVNRARNVTMIFGNPVTHYAHKADIIRLEALMRYGGIYLDLDVFVLRPFADLLRYEFVMGQEIDPDSQYVEGLCNGVIIASRKSRFLQMWHDSYTTFNGSAWNEHSVRMPLRLSHEHPTEIKVMDHKTFFWPLWTAKGLHSIFSGHEYNYSSNLAVHTWNSQARINSLNGLSFSWLLQNRSTLLGMMAVYAPMSLVSIIVPCYSDDDDFTDGLNSLTRQSWPLWQIVFAHDKNTRGCARLIQSIQHQYRHVRRIRQAAVIKTIAHGDVLLAGVQRSKGMWIMILHPKTTIPSSFFERADAAMALKPELGVIMSYVDFNNDTSRERAVLYRRPVWDALGGYMDSSNSIGESRIAVESLR